MTSFFLLRSRDLCIFKEGKTRSLFQSHLNMNEDLLNYDEFEIWRPFAWVSALVNAADAAGSLRPRSGSARENDTQTTSQLITSVFPGLDARSNILCFFGVLTTFLAIFKSENTEYRSNSLRRAEKKAGAFFQYSASMVEFLVGDTSNAWDFLTIEKVCVWKTFWDIKTHWVEHQHEINSKVSFKSSHF